MPILTLTLVVIFLIIGGISSVIGVNKLRQNKQNGNTIIWYKQYYVDMGGTSFLLALFFVLVSIPDTLPAQSIALRILFYILAGIIFLVSVIFCMLMIRYIIISTRIRRLD